MDKDTLKCLLEDLHKNELSKVGKINLEKYVTGLTKGIDELLKKYRALEDENVKLYKLYKSDELQAQRTYQKFNDCQDIQDDLKKLKGSE